MMKQHKWKQWPSLLNVGHSLHIKLLNYLPWLFITAESRRSTLWIVRRLNYYGILIPGHIFCHCCCICNVFGIFAYIESRQLVKLSDLTPSCDRVNFYYCSYFSERRWKIQMRCCEWWRISCRGSQRFDNIWSVVVMDFWVLYRSDLELSSGRSP